MKKYWISWYSKYEFGPFELHSPWWISGYSDNADMICAAIKIADEEDPYEVIYKAFDNRPNHINFRFCNEQNKDWIPFNDRFKKAAWMKWDED